MSIPFLRPQSLTLSPLVLVLILGVTQIVGYGTLYYSFAILAADVAAEFRLPVSWIMGAFSLALLLGGFAAPAVGRRMDRHGAPSVMTVGSIATASTLALAASAPGPGLFTAALVAAEVASTLVLYDAAFAALVQLCGPRARLRITHLTLIAGFASTIFWPLTTWLHGVLDWRSVLMVFAALNLLVCLPLHALLAVARPVPEEPVAAVSGTPAIVADDPMPLALRGRAFALVAWGFALSGFLLSAVLTQMVPALTALGLGGAALLVSTLFGPAQVLVRFVNMAFGVRRHPLSVTLFAMAMLPLAVVILGLTAPVAAGAAVFAILLGFGSGLKSIVQGTLPLALFGGGGYGAMLGRMAFARQFLAAMAPFAFAFSLEHGGPAAALSLLVVVALAGLACFVEVARMHRHVRPSPVPL